MPGLLLAQAQVRDSAGVRIVENRGLAAAEERFKLGRVLLEVGGLEDDPANEFDHNQGYLKGVVLSDGSLAVIDVARVHFFDPQGKRTRIVGAKGRGPAEFLYLVEVCRTASDSIVVVDSHNKRISVLDRRGEFVLSAMIPTARNAIGCIGADDVLLSESKGLGTEAAPTTVLHRMRLDGSEHQPIVALTGPSFDLVTFVEVGGAAAGREIFGGVAGEPQVRVWDENGILRRVVRTGDREERFTTSELVSLLERAAPRNFSPERRRATMERMTRMSPNRTWPVFQTLKVSPGGRMWLQRYARRGGEDDYWVSFSPTGEMEGSLRIAADTVGGRKPQVIGFGDADVLVRRRDVEGASYLTRIEIVGLPRR